MKSIAALQQTLRDWMAANADVLVDRDCIRNHASPTCTNGLRMGGVELTIDGSSQGFTAWCDRPCYEPVGKCRLFHGHLLGLSGTSV